MQTTRAVVVAEDVKQIMNSGELAISFEVGRVSRERLVQEIGGFEQLLFSTVAVGSGQENIPGASVEIERGEIGRRGTLNRRFFGRRDFGVKLLCYLLR